MATITIRNLDEEIKRKLRIQGARNNRSMEAEARAILEKSLQTADSTTGLALMIREIVTPYGGIDIEPPDRKNDTSEGRLGDLEDM